MLSKAEDSMKMMVFILVMCTSVCTADMQYEHESSDEPYSYFLRPATAIGFKDHLEATPIWPDVWGRMIFFTGDNPDFFQKRIKTLHKGYLPIVECSYDKNGIHYGIQAFGATLSGKAEDTLIMFVKISAKNETSQTRTASFWAGTAYDPLIHFSADRTYTMKKGLSLENNEVLYQYDEEEVTQKYSTLEKPYHGPVTAEEIYCVPFVTAVNLVRFDWNLAPGQTESATLKMPNTPLELDRDGKKLSKQLGKAKYDGYFRKTVDYWEDILASGAQFLIPHKKTHDVMRTAVLHLLLSKAKVGDEYLQYVSRAQYPKPFFRDAIFIQRSYSLYGLSSEAEDILRHYIGKITGYSSTSVIDDLQRALRPDEYDRRDLSKYGHRLLAFCGHYLFSGDQEYAISVLPEIKAIIDWASYVINTDQNGLIPRASLFDGEFIWDGYRIADDFWMLAGLRSAKRMGQQLNNTRLTEKADNLLKRLHPAVLKAIDKSMENVGYISGTLDKGTSPFNDGWGEDRANLCMVWPSGALSPHHPAVSATIKRMRSRFDEGITGNYSDVPGAMFHYRTLWLMQQELARGDQEWVVEDLYAVLAHTGSANGGFECATKSREGFETHGWLWARYVSFVRNMIVREEWDDTLHILSAIPAEWAQVGNTIGVRNAPTHYGTFSVTETIREDGADIELDYDWRQKPKAILLHLPYFADVSKVTVDDKIATIQGESIHLPPDAKSVNLFWRTKSRAMEFTYAKYLETFREKLEPARIEIRPFSSVQQRKTAWKTTMTMSDEWNIIGPFDNKHRTGFDTVYPPEKEIDLRAEYRGKNGRTVTWEKGWPPADLIPLPHVMPEYGNQRQFTGRTYCQTTERYHAIDFAATMRPNAEATAYAYTNIYSPITQEVNFSLGHDDTITLWVNDNAVYSFDEYGRCWRGFLYPDTARVDVTLNEGWNTVLVKVCQAEEGIYGVDDMKGWAFSLRIIDSQGKRVEGLKFDPDRQE